MTAVHTNVLVDAHRQSSPHHKAAALAISGLDIVNPCLESTAGHTSGPLTIRM